MALIVPVLLTCAALPVGEIRGREGGRLSVGISCEGCTVVGSLSPCLACTHLSLATPLHLGLPNEFLIALIVSDSWHSGVVARGLTQIEGGEWARFRCNG